MKYDAIVVGGGAAGLTCAAYLSEYGARVLLCERSGKVGGLVHSFSDEGVTFDGGIRAFENSGIVHPMLRDLGIGLDFVRNPVSILIGDQRVCLTSKESLSDYGMMLTKLFPQHAADIGRITDRIAAVMRHMDVLYGIDNPLFGGVSKDPNYLRTTLLPWLLRYRASTRAIARLQEPIRTHMRGLTDNEALIDMVVQHFFRDTPAFFALSYFALYLDYSYPLGGTGRLAELLSEAVRARGGEIATDTEVCAIDVADRRLRTADGRVYAYEKLVWACNQKTLYHAANPDGLSRRRLRAVRRQKERAENGAPGDSVLSLYYTAALDRAAVAAACGAHAFFTPDRDGLSSLPDAADLLRAIADAQNRDAVKRWTAQFLEHTTFELSCPALRDDTLAPEGEVGLIVSTLFSYPLVRAVEDAGWYEIFKRFCADTVAAVLGRTLLPGFSERVTRVRCATPRTIERRTGSAGGAITGWAFSGAEMPAEQRFPKIRHSVDTPLPHVYQAGMWTFSPSGLPVSILTGKLAADAVKKARGRGGP